MPNGRWRCRHPCSNSAVTRSGNLCKHKCCHEGLDKAPNSCSPPANMSGHDTEYDEIAEEDLLNALETIERSSQPVTIDSSSMSDCCNSDLRQIEDWLSLVAFHRSESLAQERNLTMKASYDIYGPVPEQIPVRCNQEIVWPRA
ncbi:hypothetical protein HD806DRAFT_411495 [Xylariaceae sp. AK1471]|nr:hypothetical protein HD806DRAFT_411495 [Xylariaceae sp. AK1471]